MRHPAESVPDDGLEPTHTPAGITAQAQRALMHELRDLHVSIARRQAMRDNRIAAISLSGSLSRRDMGRACGLSKARVDQIIAAVALRDQERRNAAGRAVTARHLPPESAS